MIKADQEYFNSPYYFLLRDKGQDYSLYFSSESTLTEARKKDVMIKIPKVFRNNRILIKITIIILTNCCTRTIEIKIEWHFISVLFTNQ